MHTNTLSPDSIMSPDEAIQAAMEMGLHGICFTEHDRMWEMEDIKALSSKYNFPVFRGIEVMVQEGGEILVFGLNMNFKTLVNIRTLRNLVIEADGFMIAAHPFRGFPCNTITQFEKAADIVLKRPVFDEVDAVEGYNGRNMEGNNHFACLLADKLGIPTSGGSDAHYKAEVGKCVTIFERTICNENELLAELKAGRFYGSINNKVT